MIALVRKALKAGPRKILRRYYSAATIRFGLWPRVRFRFENAHGLEIGGPSALFQADHRLLPIYAIANRVDVCNFGGTTHWEGELQEGYNFRPEGQVIGYQYICGGDDLGRIPDASLDFVLSSHNLEHLANPLRAVEEWIRVLRTGGTLVLVLPDAKRTFDHRRPVTTFEHLLEDREADRKEDDATHFDEAIHLTDLEQYPKSIAPDAAAFERICRANFQNRCLHHHVFDFQLLERILGLYGLRQFGRAAPEPYHLIVIAQKP